MGGAYKMGDVQCTHPRRTRGSSSNTPVEGGVWGRVGVEGRFRKLGRSIRPRFEFTLRIFFPPFFPSRVFPSNRPSTPSFRRRLSPPPSIYLSIHLYTSLAPTRRRLYPSPPLISSVTPSHPLRIPRCVRRRSYAQLDAQSDRSSIVRDDTRKRNCV